MVIIKDNASTDSFSSSSEDELMNPTKITRKRSVTYTKNLNELVDKAEAEAEDEEFEVADDLSAPPKEVLELYGDDMVSDYKRETMKFAASKDEAKGSDGGRLKAPIDLTKKNDRWMDAHKVDLSRGVPVNAIQDDAYKIKGQNFVCLSFIFSESYDTLHCGNRLYRGDLIKVRGVFKTRENADRYIKETLLKSDPHTKVYLARCFQWTTLEDDGDDDERTKESQQEEVDGLLRGYFENENARLSDFQKRINMVKSREKQRAVATKKFFEETIERKGQEQLRDNESQEIFEKRVEEKIDLDVLKEKLERNEEIEHHPVIELSADENRIPGQAWACVTYIQPHEYRSRSYPNEDFKRPLIKIRGVFESRLAADQFIRSKIQVLDGTTDVNLVPCFQWSGLDDDSVDEREYMGGDERCNLRELIDEYTANGNNRIYKVPQDRVREARRKQMDLARQGIRDPKKLPFDARILPDLSENELRTLENNTDVLGAVGETRPSAISAGNGTSLVTVMGASIPAGEGATGATGAGGGVATITEVVE